MSPESTVALWLVAFGRIIEIIYLTKWDRWGSQKTTLPSGPHDPLLAVMEEWSLWQATAGAVHWWRIESEKPNPNWSLNWSLNWLESLIHVDTIWYNQNPTRNSSPYRSIQVVPVRTTFVTCLPGALVLPGSGSGDARVHQWVWGSPSDWRFWHILTYFDLVFDGFSMIFFCFVWDVWGCDNTELNELRSTSVCFAFVQPFRVRHYGNCYAMEEAPPQSWPECCTHAACGMHDSLPVFSQVI